MRIRSCGSIGALRDVFNALRAKVTSLSSVAATNRTLINELRDDHATFKTVVDDLKTLANANLADLTALRTKYNAVLTKLDADGGVSDTNYNATQAMSAVTGTSVASSSPATLSAAAVAAVAADTSEDLEG